MNSPRFLTPILFLLLICSCGKSPFIKASNSTSSEILKRRELQESNSTVRFNSSGYSAQLVWPNPPEAYELVSPYLFFYDQSGKVFDPIEFHFKPMMPDMGHGTSPVTIKRIERGLYKIEEIYFSMPGKWVIEITIKNNGQDEKSSIDIYL